MKACRMMMSHMTIEALPYGKPVQSWLKDRYGETEDLGTDTAELQKLSYGSSGLRRI